MGCFLFGSAGVVAFSSWRALYQPCLHELAVAWIQKGYVVVNCCYGDRKS